jgi:hypothetical protein
MPRSSRGTPGALRGASGALRSASGVVGYVLEKWRGHDMLRLVHPGASDLAAHFATFEMSIIWHMVGSLAVEGHR